MLVKVHFSRKQKI